MRSRKQIRRARNGFTRVIACVNMRALVYEVGGYASTIKVGGPLPPPAPLLLPLWVGSMWCCSFQKCPLSYIETDNSAVTVKPV